ncbi:polysaccharide deacetylase family protein [Undibacterium arcticum]
MLSRYEEAVSLVRDEHDRFPAKASLACSAGFIDRPIVDEYIAILWSALTRLWPNLERKQHRARTLISCDIDSPFDPACASLYRLGKRVLARSWRDKSLDRLPMTVRDYLAVKHGDYSSDPYRSGIDWIMDANERAGNQVAFYFICEQTDEKRDTSVNVDEPRMRAMMRSVHARGHEIGIHPGYDTYKNPAKFAQSVSKLRRIMEEEGIKQDVLGGRQHYLRWETPTTAQLWEANGLTYDTTLSYAERAGFRCGTCHEYHMYDLINRKRLNLLQRPLVVMESTVIDMQCMGLGYGDAARELIYRYKRICHQFDGDFTLLWHNSYFENRAAKEMCSDVINAQVPA